ncbi:hypothetical protein CLAIMM_12658 [Cladophialophora immunda]|nr:hypothetical protein CLAIMM_12658 [Cladophialophora immunda]
MFAVPPALCPWLPQPRAFRQTPEAFWKPSNATLHYKPRTTTPPNGCKIRIWVATFTAGGVPDAVADAEIVVVLLNTRLDVVKVVLCSELTALVVLLFSVAELLELVVDEVLLEIEDDRVVEEEDAVDEAEFEMDALLELLVTVVPLADGVPTTVPEFERVICDWELNELMKEEMLLWLAGELDVETEPDPELDAEVEIELRGFEIDTVVDNVFVVSGASDAVLLELCGAEAVELGLSDGPKTEVEETGDAGLADTGPATPVAVDPCAVAG